MADVSESLSTDRNLSKERHALKTKRNKFPIGDYIRRRRQPYAFARRENKDVFVTNKTNFKAQLKKCEKLLDNGAFEVVIHGLGAAIHRACDLALQLKEIHHGGVELDIKTSTVPIIDDFEPLNDDVDYEVNNRCNSAVHIRVFRKFVIGGIKYSE